MRGLVVIGTDTGVGKTLVSAALVAAITTVKPAVSCHYWKPVQTGTDEDDDTLEIARLMGTDQLSFPPVYHFRAPLSPHLASRLENSTIQLSPLLAAYRAARTRENSFLVVETAGGVLTPLASDLLQIDFVRALDLPALLVVNDRLGAINHTLLSLEACAARKIPVAGLVLNRRKNEVGNKSSLEEFAPVSLQLAFDEARSKEAALDQMRLAFTASRICCL